LSVGEMARWSDGEMVGLPGARHVPCFLLAPASGGARDFYIEEPEMVGAKYLEVDPTASPWRCSDAQDDRLSGRKGEARERERRDDEEERAVGFGGISRPAFCGKEVVGGGAGPVSAAAVAAVAERQAQGEALTPRFASQACPQCCRWCYVCSAGLALGVVVGPGPGAGSRSPKTPGSRSDRAALCGWIDDRACPSRLQCAPVFPWSSAPVLQWWSGQGGMDGLRNC